MDIFPPELWSKIFRKVPRPELRTLCATSHFTRQVAEAELYRDVNIARLTQDGYEEGQNKETTIFARAIAARPELAALVGKLTIESSLPEVEVPLEGHMDHPIFAQYAALVNIHTIVLACFRIDEEFCAALLSLPQLASASFLECEVDPAILETYSPSPSRDQQTLDLLITYPLSGVGWGAAAASFGGELQHLMINHSNLNIVYRFMDTILAELQETGQSRTLTSVEFGFELPLTIFSFLPAAPNIKRIVFADVHGDPEDPLAEIPADALPADALPRLEHYAGPADYAEVFIRGRPVRSVSLDLPPETTKDTLASLQTPSVTITELALNGNVSDGAHLQHVPSTVQHLRWSVNETEDMSSECIPWLSHLVDLRVLLIKSKQIPVEDQDKIAKAVLETCPSIRELSFEVKSEENVRFLRLGGGWERYSVVNDCKKARKTYF